MTKIGIKLIKFYKSMHSRFGDRHWWPGESRLEICVGAILTQNTNWGNVEKAIANLQAAECLDLHKLHEISTKKLANLIRPAGYYNIKSRRLKNFIGHIFEQWGGDLGMMLDRSVPEIRADLLSVNGIGPETADSIILYAAEKPTFVVDAYTGRIFRRHGLIEADAVYDSIKELCESKLPIDVGLWNDFHAQIVETGKKYCKPKARCEGCPLEKYLHDPTIP